MLCIPAGALGSTIDHPNGDSTVQFSAAAGEANRVTVTTSDGTVTFADTAANITIDGADAGCSHPDANPKIVTCTALADITNWSAQLDNQDDTLVATGPLGGFADGGAGTDELTGGAGDDFLTGGDGHDKLVGGPGDDSAVAFEGGADSDTVDQGDGDDEVSGAGPGTVITLGPGDDEIFYSDEPGTGGGKVDGGPGLDQLDYISEGGTVLSLLAATYTPKTPALPVGTLTNFEDVTGGSLVGDTVTGTNAANSIDTSRGNGMALVIPDALPNSGPDVVNPLAGADIVKTGDGNDQITANDGFADRINCGAGTDAVTADQLDELTGCENVTVAKERPAGADKTPPVCSFTKAAKTAKRSSFSKSYSATFRCNEAVTVAGKILLSAKRKGGRIKLSKVGDVTLAEKSTSAAANVSTKLTLKISKGLRSSLPSKFTARVVLEARDEFGNRTTITRKVKVSTPKKKRKKR